MKKTLPGSSEVRKEATSALRSSAGPAVCTIGTPISAATMWASEVLPSPGGPASRTWSSGSPRPRAASMKIASCSVTCAWLTKSARVGGRSERSRSSSGTSARASWTRTSASTGTGSASMPGRADPVGADVGRVAHARLRAAAALRSAAATSSCGSSPSRPSSSCSASSGA